MSLIKKSKVTKLKSVKPMFTQEEYEALAQEYSDISKEEKVLKKRKKELADTLKEGAEKIGVKDDKGSYYIDGADFIIGRVARKSYSIDKEIAPDLLKKKGIYEECIDIVEVINEDKIQQAVDNDLLTLEEVESITKVKESYSISVKETEKMPEVEVSNLKSVAKRKAGR